MLSKRKKHLAAQIALGLALALPMEQLLLLKVQSMSAAARIVLLEMKV